jgi:hypothetical protein
MAIASHRPRMEGSAQGYRKIAIHIHGERTAAFYLWLFRQLNKGN